MPLPQPDECRKAKRKRKEDVFSRPERQSEQVSGQVKAEKVDILLQCLIFKVPTS